MSIIKDEERFKVVTISERLDDENILRKNQETYIIGAMSLTDVEARATVLLEEISDGEFKVVSANPISFARHILANQSDEEDNRWYEVKIAYKHNDSESDKLQYKDKYLVKAKSLEEAETLTADYFGADGGFTFEILSASKTTYEAVINCEESTYLKTKKGWAVSKVKTEE